MKNEILVDVKLYGKKVGVLAWNKEKGLAEFQYYPDFLKNGWDIAPIVMPLKREWRDMVYTFPMNRNECFKGLPGLVADSLPDKYGNEIIDAWFASQGIAETTITPLDRLCYMGKRAMGALEFEPSRNIKGLDESSLLRMDCLVELADKVFKDRETFKRYIREEDKTILDILKIGTSAGGAKPKAVIAWNEQTNEIRSGQVKAPEGYSYWLIKFDETTFNENGEKINHPKGISNIEYAYHQMAKDCRIQMSECRLFPEGNSFHFITKRFDRLNDGDKIHMQTLAAIAHYDRDSLHSYEEAFRVMRKLGLNYEETEQFFRRMVFNVVARNHDDHTKNHSFLMDKEGKWRLAPAYDLCYAYSPGGKWTNMHQMSVNGKRENIEWEDLEEVGKKMDIKNNSEIIGEVIEKVSQWKNYAKDSGVYENHLSLIEKNLCLLKPNKRHVKYKITDTTVIGQKTGNLQIRCKMDGVQQCAKPMTTEEIKEYDRLKIEGNEEDLKRFLENTAQKHFTGTQTKSQGLKR